MRNLAARAFRKLSAHAGAMGKKMDIQKLTERPYFELSPAEKQALANHFKGNAYPETFPWKWNQVRYNRLALVNMVVGTRPDCAYLEIGCDANTLFDAVPALDKTGVDPARGGTHRMTSDEFFAQNTKKFDFVWIDGLHEYRQVHRDVENALAALKPGGWIGLHDMLPVMWQQEHMPRMHPGWTGDVWKVGYEMTAARGLDFRIVLIDHGVGLLKAEPGHDPLPDMGAELADQRFGYLYENIDRLNLVEFPEASAWVHGAGA